MAIQTDLNIEERKKLIDGLFSSLSSWEDRYKKIIELGKSVPNLEESLKDPKYIVQGCQSQVWLVPKFENGKVYFQADSDALLVKGLVYVLLQTYSGLTPSEIVNLPNQFLSDLGFDKNLTPSRTNGLFSMVKQIKMYATAFMLLGSR